MRRLVFAIASLALLATASSAQESKKVVLEIPAIEKQKTPVWCWAACIQNVLSTYGVKVEQKQVVRATYGDVANLPLFDPRQAVGSLLKANALVAPKGKVVHPYIVGGAPRADILLRELSKEKSPVMVFYRRGMGGHVVMCYGIEYTPTAQGPLITKVFVKDPWEGKEKTWGGAQLASVWSATIFLRVAPKPKVDFTYQRVPYRITPSFEVLNRQLNRIEGRIWYLREKKAWHVFDLMGRDRGKIP